MGPWRQLLQPETGERKALWGSHDQYEGVLQLLQKPPHFHLTTAVHRVCPAAPLQLRWKTCMYHGAVAVAVFISDAARLDPQSRPRASLPAAPGHVVRAGYLRASQALQLYFLRHCF